MGEDGQFMRVEFDRRDDEFLYINEIMFTLNYTEYGNRLHLWRNSGVIALCDERDRMNKLLKKGFFIEDRPIDGYDNMDIDSFVDFVAKHYKGKLCIRCKNKLPPI